MELQTSPRILLICLFMAFCCLPVEVLAQSASDGTAQYVKGITSGPAWSIVGGIIALISLIIGWRAKVRSGLGKRTQALISLSLGGIAIILSLIHLGTSAGAVFGSGSGKAGVIVALILALISAVISGTVLRSKSQ